MATIVVPIDMEIEPANPPSAGLLVRVSYRLQASDNDVQSGQPYHELAQLVSQGGLAGHGGELLIPGGTVMDRITYFADADASFDRSGSVTLPLAILENGGSPLQPDPIQARVTLTPILPVELTAMSAAVALNRPPVVTA